MYYFILMRNIISRKYILDVSENKTTGNLQTLRCLNRDGQKEAPGDLPSEVEFYPSGNVKRMTWHRADKKHRDHDCPANLLFKDTPSFEVTSASWHQQGKEHREGAVPSHIMIDENDGRVCLMQFCRHGEECSVDGLPPYIWINADGSTEDEGGYPIDVDLSRFQGELPRPPPVTPPPFLTLD